MIDSGIDLIHPEFSGRISGGVDFVDGGEPQDFSGHGTETAGILGADGNNGLFGAGINWGANLVPIRVLDENDSESPPGSVANGIVWAQQNGLPIVNMSLNDLGEESTPAEYAALKNAHASGMFICVSAGNNNGAVQTPAANPFVCAVGAIYANGIRWTNTQLNQEWGCDYPANGGSAFGEDLDLGAPGGQSIPTTWLSTGDSLYSYLDPGNHCKAELYRGTSAAAPMVTGVASLVHAISPGLDGEDIKRVLELTADMPSFYSPSGWNEDVGFGSVNTLNALEFVRDKSLAKGVATNLSTYATNEMTMQIYGDAVIVDGIYYVRRYEMRKSVVFNSEFSTIPDCWSSNRGSGWSTSVKHADREPDGWGDVVPGTESSLGLTARTYVYEFLYQIGSGDPVPSWKKWRPVPPALAKVSWTAMGNSSVVGVEAPHESSRALTVQLGSNPAHGTAEFLVNGGASGGFVVEIFSTGGRLLRTLRYAGSTGRVTWDGRTDSGMDAPNGVYLYRASDRRGSTFGKLVLAH